MRDIRNYLYTWNTEIHIAWNEKTKRNTAWKCAKRIIKIKKIGFYFMLVYSVCTEQVGEISKHRSKSLLWYFFFFPSLLSLVIWYVECNLVLANYPQWRWHAWIVFICFHSSVGSFFFFAFALSVSAVMAVHFSSFVPQWDESFVSHISHQANDTILLGIRKNEYAP